MVVCTHPDKAASDREGNRYCLACATENELEAIKTASDYAGYIGSDERFVTTWTGAALGEVTSLWTSKRARKRYVTMVDKQGVRWYGSGPAESGTYVNLHRYKNQ